MRVVTEPPLSFGARLALAFACFFRVLFDGRYAARVSAAAASAPALPAPEPEPEAAEPSVEPALQLLALLQREGSLVDFLQQDVSEFGDADVGAAARAVHDRCAHALARQARLTPIVAEEEGATLTLEAGFDSAAIKLTGNVRGAPPYRGVVRHRGWRAESLELPRVVGEGDARIVAPAEIEL